MPLSRVKAAGDSVDRRSYVKDLLQEVARTTMTSKHTDHSFATWQRSWWTRTQYETS